MKVKINILMYRKASQNQYSDDNPDLKRIFNNDHSWC